MLGNTIKTIISRRGNRTHRICERGGICVRSEYQVKHIERKAIKAGRLDREERAGEPPPARLSEETGLF